MKIALVEDEKKLATTLQEGLVSEGYEVEVIPDGEQAIKEFSANAHLYSILLLDIMLPKKDGFEVCEQLRQQGLKIPILVLTARDSIEDKVRMLNSGADDFITKPFSFDELIARIRAHSRRAQGFTGTKVDIGNLHINMDAREVFRDTTRIPLTPTEFNLLRFLIENSERALAREEISAHLWDVTDGTLTNIVDVHISNLRRKIDDNYAQKVIRTVRGAGYAIQK